MFIKKSAIKKLFKAAFNAGGLHVVNDGDGYRFKGGYWDLWIKHGYLPNVVKANAIELIGDLPEAGQAGLYDKFGCQTELPYTEGPRELMEVEGPIFIDTGMIVINKRKEVLRVMQNEESGKILLPYNHIMESISPLEIDFEGGESDVQGAFNPNSNILLLKNNVSAFLTYARTETYEMRAFKELMEKHNIYNLIHPEEEE